MAKQYGSVQAGAEDHWPAGFLQGFTLKSVSGPEFTITEDGNTVAVGQTIGAGAVVISRTDDGNTEDSAFVMDDGQTGGQDGAAATLAIGTVTTGQPGTQASVTNSGTASAAVLDIVIPQGVKGDRGDKGDSVKGDKGDTGRGIASVGQTNGHLTGTYSDGTNWDAGVLPVGTGSTSELAFTADLIAVGDSITAGYESGSGTQDYPTAAWPSVLGSIRHWTVTNYGMDGSELTSVNSDAHPMVDRIGAAVPAGYTGHVALAGGTNDYNVNRALANPGSTDKQTVYGALLTAGRTVLTQAPGCLLHLVTPLYRADGGHTEGTYNSAGYTLEQVRQAVRDVADQLGREYPGHVQLHDAGRELSPWLAAPNNAYLAADGVHLTAAGEMLLAQHLAMQMRGADGVAQPAGSVYNRAFSSLTAGNLNGQDGWTVYGGTASVDSAGLHLTSPFDGSPRGVLHTLPSGTTHVQGTFTVQNSSGAGVMLRAVHQLSDDSALCAWSVSGTLDWGIVKGSSATSWIGSYGPILPAVTTLEITLNGSSAELRYWDASSGKRPDAAQYTHANPNLTPDAFGFSSIGPNAQLIQSVATS